MCLAVTWDRTLFVLADIYFLSQWQNLRNSLYQDLIMCMVIVETSEETVGMKGFNWLVQSTTQVDQYR